MHRCGENAAGGGWRDTKREPFMGNATRSVAGGAENAPTKAVRMHFRPATHGFERIF